MTTQVVTCPERPDVGPHESSDTLCVWCLEYDRIGELGCDGHGGGRHEASDTMCVWFLQYDLVDA